MYDEVSPRKTSFDNKHFRRAFCSFAFRYLVRMLQHWQSALRLNRKEGRLHKQVIEDILLHTQVVFKTANINVGILRFSFAVDGRKSFLSGTARATRLLFGIGRMKFVALSLPLLQDCTHFTYFPRYLSKR